MPISQILALAKDVLIVGAIAYVLWFIHHADTNAAKVADLKAVETQLNKNAATEAQWLQRFSDAEKQRQLDMQTVTAAIGSNHQPIIVRVPASGGAVSGPSSTTPSGSTAGGPTDQGPGIDIRSNINAFELKYEGYLATCRALKEEWPK